MHTHLIPHLTCVTRYGYITTAEKGKTWCDSHDFSRPFIFPREPITYYCVTYFTEEIIVKDNTVFIIYYATVDFTE